MLQGNQSREDCVDGSARTQRVSTMVITLDCNLEQLAWVATCRRCIKGIVPGASWWGTPSWGQPAARSAARVPRPAGRAAPPTGTASSCLCWAGSSLFAPAQHEKVFTGLYSQHGPTYCNCSRQPKFGFGKSNCCTHVLVMQFLGCRLPTRPAI